MSKSVNYPIIQRNVVEISLETNDIIVYYTVDQFGKRQQLSASKKTFDQIYLKDEYKMIRYVITHMGKNGLRTLTFAAQGRHTFDTEGQAQDYLNLLLENGIKTRMPNGCDWQTLEVRPVECWDHKDPKTCYFDD